MKKVLWAVLCCLSISLSVFGQNTGEPVVTFPANGNLCDPTPYKLVFYDDFNGTQLDRSKWRTYNSWSGQWTTSGLDSPNFGEGRVLPHEGHGIALDENVVVDNGICRLFAKFQPGLKWHCDSCTMDTFYADNSGAWLSMYWYYNFKRMAYNTCRIEARIKYPTFDRAHGDVWTWPGETAHNSIDVAEAYGDPYFQYGTAGSNNRFCDLSLHNDHQEVMVKYPHQTWWDYVKGTFFDQYNWHTYTCEWDTAVIKFSLDGIPFRTFYKYIQIYNYAQWKKDPQTGMYYYKVYYMRVVPNGCSVSGANWNICDGFPYHKHQMEMWNFTLDEDRDIPYDRVSGYQGPFTLGEMDIDFVKVWQRHPDSDNHVNICNENNSIVNASPIICGNGLFSLSAAAPGGTWTFAGNVAPTQTSNSSASVVPIAGSTSDWGKATYTYNVAGCPTQMLSATVDVGPPSVKATVICSHTKQSLNHLESFNLAVQRPYNIITSHGAPTDYLAPTTFEWNIDYGPNYSLHYHTFGQYVSTPFTHYATFSTTGVKWSVKISNSCGSVTKTGSQSYFNLYRTTADTTADDSTLLYVEADITDSAAYESAVNNRVWGEAFIENTSDTVAINNIIERIRLEELQPYLIMDSGDTTKGSPKTKTVQGITALTTDTRLYPNPASKNLNVSPGRAFNTESPIEITIYNTEGRLCINSIVNYTGDIMSVDVSSLASGIYIVRLKQNKHMEQLKLKKG